MPQPGLRNDRLPHMIPKALMDDLFAKWENHLPRPHKSIFYEFVLGLGMDSYEKGVEPTAGLIGRDIPEEDMKRVRFETYMDPDVVSRLEKLHKTHHPPAMAKDFFEFVMNLGVQQYEREYTIYGFRKDSKPDPVGRK